MDYSTITTDHPTEGSPWGSPRAERGTLPTSSNDIPSSPLPGQEQFADEAGRGRNEEPQSPDLSAQLQSAQLGDPDYPQEQSPFAAHQSPNAQQQSPTPAQYQTEQRQNSRPYVPTYKIQGKITGLERTGKKDPILRFEVHVGLHR
jgi:hypothetical protein